MITPMNADDAVRAVVIERRGPGSNPGDAPLTRKSSAFIGVIIGVHRRSPL